jgi:hypothetical protein
MKLSNRRKFKVVLLHQRSRCRRCSGTRLLQIAEADGSIRTVICPSCSHTPGPLAAAQTVRRREADHNWKWRRAA